MKFVFKGGVGIGLTLVFLLGATGEGRAQGNWKERWAKTVEAAKKEGKVVIDGPPRGELYYREFEKSYPEIRVVPETGGQRIERIFAERRVGKYLTDMRIGGGGPMRDLFHNKAKLFDPIKPTLILPEVVDESKWWGGKHIYLDEEGQYILAFNAIIQNYFHYQTELVNPNDFKSYWDFLDTRWKGKIVVWEPMAPGTDGVLRFLYHNPEIGPRFLRRFLGEMDVTVTRDKRQFVDWLASGKFLLAGLQSSDRAELGRAKSQGVPVNWFDPKRFKEGVPLSTSSGNIAVYTRAPHPNAAAVFINWFLSREGQTIYQKMEALGGGGKDSLRIDIPKNDVPEEMRRADGVRYSVLVAPEYMELEPVSKLVNEVWKRRR